MPVVKLKHTAGNPTQSHQILVTVMIRVQKFLLISALHHAMANFRARGTQLQLEMVHVKVYSRALRTVES